MVEKYPLDEDLHKIFHLNFNPSNYKIFKHTIDRVFKDKNTGEIFIEESNIWDNPKEIRKIRSKVGLVFQYPEYQLFAETVKEICIISSSLCADISG